MKGLSIFKKLVCVIGIIVFISDIFGQDLNSENQKKLNQFIGKWTAVFPDSSILIWDMTSTVLNNGIYSKGIIKNRKGIFYQADGLWGLNPEDNQIACYEITSTKEHKIHKGFFTKDNILYLAIYKKESKNLYQESWMELNEEKNILTMRMKYYDEKGTTETWILKREK
jgi:hypothetical protein